MEGEIKENAKDKENMVLSNMKDADILMNMNTQSEFKDEDFLFNLDKFDKHDQEIISATNNNEQGRVTISVSFLYFWTPSSNSREFFSVITSLLPACFISKVVSTIGAVRR